MAGVFHRAFQSPNRDTMTVPVNLFDDIPEQTPNELLEVLASGQNVRIERIVSFGNTSPEGFWYDQDQQEWVLLLQGAARLLLEDRFVDLKPGDSLNIPAHTRHRVEWTDTTQPTIWLAIHYA
jgi:cupin 2 domain-containing protein